MSIKGKAFIAGVYEHPERKMPDKTITQLHAEVAMGALKDAGLSLSDVDGYAIAGGDINMPGVAMADYLGLKLAYVDSTYTGGSSPVYHVGHAANAIAEGKAQVVLITLANRALSAPPRRGQGESSEYPFENLYGTSTLGMYALAAQRHMHEYGTTSAQLAEVKVAASHHAQVQPQRPPQAEGDGPGGAGLAHAQRPVASPGLLRRD